MASAKDFTVQNLVEKVLKILAEEGDVRDVEKILVKILDFEKFDLYFHFVCIQIPINWNVILH